MNYNIDTEEGMANAVCWMEQTLATPSKNAHLADSQSSRNLHHRQK